MASRGLPRQWRRIADPALLDPELPWNRNVLNFEAVVGPDTIECVIEPAYQTLTLRWVRRERELVYLDLERVAGIEVDRYRGRASLIVRTCSFCCR